MSISSNAFVSHIAAFWSNHTAAISASIWSLLSLGSILNSIVVGVSVFVITTLLREGISLIKNKLKGK